VIVYRGFRGSDTEGIFQLSQVLLVTCWLSSSSSPSYISEGVARLTEIHFLSVICQEAIDNLRSRSRALIHTVG